jgi:hypothetical protein
MHCNKRKVSQIVKAAPDPDYREGQHIQRSRTEHATPKKVTCEIAEWLTTTNRADRPAHADRNQKLSSRPAFPYILGVMQGVMELTEQEQPAFDTSAFFGHHLKRHLIGESQKAQFERIKISVLF